MNVTLQVCCLVGAFGVTAIAAAPPQTPVESARYTVTDVGTLGGVTSEAFGLNVNGMVVGRSETAEGKQHAFLFFPKGFTKRANGTYAPGPHGKPALLDLTPASAANSEARAINRDGMAAGFVQTGADRRAVVWNGTSQVSLGPNGAYAINNKGQAGGENRLWQMGRNQATMLAPFVCDTVCSVYGISETGEAVGAELFDTTHGTTRPFLWHGGKLETLIQPYSKAAPAAAYGINNRGEIVGTDGRQAFLWQEGKVTWLGGAAIRSSTAYAINDRGLIVGQADLSWRDESLRAVIWEQGKMTDLNTLIAPHSGWTLEEARGINARGQICGTGLFGGKRHAFLLTPLSQ